MKRLYDERFIEQNLADLGEIYNNVGATLIIHELCRLIKKRYNNFDLSNEEIKRIQRFYSNELKRELQ